MCKVSFIWNFLSGQQILLEQYLKYFEEKKVIALEFIFLYIYQIFPLEWIIYI